MKHAWNQLIREEAIQSLQDAEETQMNVFKEICLWDKEADSLEDEIVAIESTIYCSKLW